MMSKNKCGLRKESEPAVDWAECGLQESQSTSCVEQDNEAEQVHALEIESKQQTMLGGDDA